MHDYSLLARRRSAAIPEERRRDWKAPRRDAAAMPTRDRSSPPRRGNAAIPAGGRRDCRALLRALDALRARDHSSRAPPRSDPAPLGVLPRLDRASAKSALTATARS